MEVNKNNPPKSARPIVKSIKKTSANIHALKKILGQDSAYPQTLSLNEVHSKKWKCVWKEGDLTDDEESVFLNNLGMNRNAPLYIALAKDITSSIQNRLKVAETKNFDTWTLAFLRAGFLYVPQPDVEHSFFADLAWNSSVYFQLPIKFVMVRNGDSILDPIIIAGIKPFIDAMTNSNDGSWCSGLPT